MLWSLRMMQRAEAGMPNAAAIVIRVAVDVINETDMKESRLEPTYITPDRRPVQRVVGPYDGVHKLVETGQRGPHHVIARPSVPRFQVPW